jgi:hypothetical protein
LLGAWRIDGEVKKDGRTWYVCVGARSHREAQNVVATFYVGRMCFGNVVLVEKGKELK